MLSFIVLHHTLEERPCFQALPSPRHTMITSDLWDEQPSASSSRPGAMRAFRSSSRSRMTTPSQECFQQLLHVARRAQTSRPQATWRFLEVHITSSLMEVSSISARLHVMHTKTAPSTSLTLLIISKESKAFKSSSSKTTAAPMPASWNKL
jgi:hypothetical protein